jgi:hypothetical protein
LTSAAIGYAWAGFGFFGRVVEGGTVEGDDTVGAAAVEAAIVLTGVAVGIERSPRSAEQLLAKNTTTAPRTTPMTERCFTR